MMIRDIRKCLNYSLIVYATLIISFIFGDFISNPLLLENDLVIGVATYYDSSTGYYTRTISYERYAYVPDSDSYIYVHYQ